MTLKKIALTLGSLSLIAACGEPTSPSADSGPVQCDCPASEPPLTGRIVRVEADGGNVNAGPTASETFAGCPMANAKLLGGGCYIEEVGLAQTNQYHLIDSAMVVLGQDVWRCRWTNDGTTPAHVIMTLTCLNPAQ